jgi:hypothetical protein
MRIKATKNCQTIMEKREVVHSLRKRRLLQRDRRAMLQLKKGKKRI